MPRRCPQHQALLSLLVVFASFVCLSVGANTEPQTITSLAAYRELDPCAQACFYFNAFVPGCTYGVEVHVGCSWVCYTGAANDCFCRADKQPVATSFLSSCISAGCTVGDRQIDVNSGVGVYTGYCSSLGYGVVAGTTPSPSIVPLASTTTSVKFEEARAGRRGVVSFVFHCDICHSGKNSEESVNADFEFRFRPSPSSPLSTTSAASTSSRTPITDSVSTPTQTVSSPPLAGNGNSSGGLSPGDKATIAGTVAAFVAVLLTMFGLALKWHLMDQSQRATFKESLRNLCC